MQWSKEGVSKVTGSDDGITCSSRHLSIFAIENVKIN